MSFTADITKMYRQILVNEMDVDYQRILWRSNSTDAVQDFRLLTVTYGLISAPYLALRVLQQLNADEGALYPLAASVLSHQTYVDDCIFGADDIQTALATREQLTELLNKGGFPLRKWANNHRTLLDGIDPSDHGIIIKEFNSCESIKVLGIYRQPGQNVFKIRVCSLSKPVFTNRAILSTISKLFDPLG